MYLGFIALVDPDTAATQVIDDFSDVDYTWPNGEVVPDATLPQVCDVLLTG